MLFSPILSALALLGSVTVGAVTITRSSLLGYDIADVGHGLTLDEAALKLETLAARVMAAVESCRRSLKYAYLLTVDFAVSYTVDSNGYNAAVIKASLPGGERGTWQEKQVLSTLVYCLRENFLAASGVGHLEASARLLGEEGLAELEEREEELAGQRDERW